MVCHTTISQRLTNFPVTDANLSIFTTFYPFYPILVIKYYFTALLIAYMPSTLQTLSNDVPYMHIKERWNTLNMGGGAKSPPSEKGAYFRSQFRRGSIIVSYHLKTMCGNFHACIMILQLMPFPVARTSQVSNFIVTPHTDSPGRHI